VYQRSNNNKEGARGWDEGNEQTDELQGRDKTRKVQKSLYGYVPSLEQNPENGEGRAREAITCSWYGNPRPDRAWD